MLLFCRFQESVWSIPCLFFLYFMVNCAILLLFCRFQESVWSIPASFSFIFVFSMQVKYSVDFQLLEVANRKMFPTKVSSIEMALIIVLSAIEICSTHCHQLKCPQSYGPLLKLIILPCKTCDVSSFATPKQLPNGIRVTSTLVYQCH